MVRRARGAAVGFGDTDIAHARSECRRGPDMVKTTALVCGSPVGRTVAPPRIQLRRLRRMSAHHIDPAAGFAGGDKLLAFDRRMRDNAQHLLVTPDIVLERGDVEVADQYRAFSRYR